MDDDDEDWGQQFINAIPTIQNESITFRNENVLYIEDPKNESEEENDIEFTLDYDIDNSELYIEPLTNWFGSVIISYQTYNNTATDTGTGSFILDVLHQVIVNSEE